MKLFVLALALLAMPRNSATTYDVYVRVGWQGQTMERCAIDLIVDGQVAGHADTLEDGLARFDGLKTERFELMVRREGFFDRLVVVYNFARRDVHEQLELKKRVKWQLSGTVRGKGAMIPNARVRLLEGGDALVEATTDADGVFTFPALFDTECRFSAEAPGFHRQTVWMANRAQRDLVTDVELRPAAGRPGDPWEYGEPENNVELRYWRRPARRMLPGGALGALFDVSRIFPADDRPAGALSGARIDLSAAGLRGSLARVERALNRLVQPYPRR